MDVLTAQLPLALAESHLPSLPPPRRGKVRDVYDLGDRLLMVATDRLSAFDRVLTTVPFKGAVLNEISAFWMRELADIVPNHLLEVPHPNASLVTKTEPIPVEVVVRGYLSGSLWRDYDAGRHAVLELDLPPGMALDQRLPEPLLTPSTKAEVGGHDRPISEREVVGSGLVSPKRWGEIREVALALFMAGQRLAASRGLLLVDTKYELGLLDDHLVLIDEIHTPDSSRFWEASDAEERRARGERPRMLDKEIVRRWLLERGFSGHGEAPEIPDALRVQLAETYLSAFERITGAPLAAAARPSDVGAELAKLTVA